jgi:hypothetical protein
LPVPAATLVHRHARSRRGARARSRRRTAQRRQAGGPWPGERAFARTRRCCAMQVYEARSPSFCGVPLPSCNTSDGWLRAAAVLLASQLSQK